MRILIYFLILLSLYFFISFVYNLKPPTPPKCFICDKDLLRSESIQIYLPRHNKTLYICGADIDSLELNILKYEKIK